MKITALLRVGRNVSDLERAADFYTHACGFQPVEPVREDPQLAHVLAVERVRILRLRLGAQEIELSECLPKAGAYPKQSHANDAVFQHIAIITTDIAAACDSVIRLGAKTISNDGPVHLPVSSGDVVAFKFRDPDGHPLEFLQFPAGAGKPPEGYDHSAICVSDIASSLAFYAELGVLFAARQVNEGPEQDALDGLRNVIVDVLALQPPQATPHVELLCYRRPQAGLAAPYAPGDICADRLVFDSETGSLKLLRDPDGHVILLDGR
jgi:catechol 2,3-dioxygenase-like lactoylglutathione lyase family enzyme